MQKNDVKVGQKVKFFGSTFVGRYFAEGTVVAPFGDEGNEWEIKVERVIQSDEGLTIESVRDHSADQIILLHSWNLEAA